eukprot:scaffold4634_cov112-Isochrysis_galbana.AAC.3
MSVRTPTKAEVYLKLAADARKRHSSDGATSPSYAWSSGSVEGPSGLKAHFSDLDETVTRSPPVAPVWDEPETPAAGYASALTSPTSPVMHDSELESPVMTLRMNRQLQEALEQARAAQDDLAVRLQRSEAAERAATAEAQHMSELAGSLKAAVAGLQADLQKKFAERSAGLQSSVAELQLGIAARNAQVR